MTQRSCKVNGFTLVALIAAVTGPRFFDINTFRVSGFYDETLASVRYAQKLAVATNCNVRVNITATGFSLFRPLNGDNTEEDPTGCATFGLYRGSPKHIYQRERY